MIAHVEVHCDGVLRAVYGFRVALVGTFVWLVENESTDGRDLDLASYSLFTGYYYQPEDGSLMTWRLTEESLLACRAIAAGRSAVSWPSA